MAEASHNKYMYMDVYGTPIGYENALDLVNGSHVHAHIFSVYKQGWWRQLETESSMYSCSVQHNLQRRVKGVFQLHRLSPPLNVYFKSKNKFLTKCASQLAVDSYPTRYPDISPKNSSPSDSSPSDSSPNDSSPNTQFTECPFHRMHNSQNDSSPSSQFAEQTFHRKKEKTMKDGENFGF